MSDTLPFIYFHKPNKGLHTLKNFVIFAKEYKVRDSYDETI